MGIRETFLPWPVFRQVQSVAGAGDRLARGAAARSRQTDRQTDRLTPRTSTADRVVGSVCPYCAVGCGQLVYVKDEQVVQIEGDPASPVSRGRLCPKGAATKQLVTNPLRQTRVRYRRPHGTQWEDLDLDTAMDMIADRVIATRARTWTDRDEQGRRLRRTMGIAALGGATLDNEENYLIKKLGTVWHEAHRELPYLFGASALAAAGGLVAATSPAREAMPARLAGIAGAVAAQVVNRAVHRRLGPVVEPLSDRRPGRLLRASRWCAGTGTALLAVSVIRPRRALDVAGGLVLAVESAMTKFGYFHAGTASAADPKHTVLSQRARATERR